jgi:hypothetical protein
MRALIALFAAAMCSSAYAGDETSKSHDKSMKSADSKFESLDRNDDRQLSRSEASQEDGLSAQFASVDQDADGFVSKSEYTARLEEQEPRSSDEPREPY